MMFDQGMVDNRVVYLLLFVCAFTNFQGILNSFNKKFGSHIQDFTPETIYAQLVQTRSFISAAVRNRRHDAYGWHPSISWKK